MSQQPLEGAAVTRRSFINLGLAGAAVPVTGYLRKAQAASRTLVVVSSGGKLEEAFTEAYYKPWTAKTGIEIITGTNPPAKLKAMVDSGKVEWDVVQIDSTIAAALGRQGLLEPIDYSVVDKTNLVPSAVHEFFVCSDVAATVMAWNTKRLEPGQVPHTWAEFWDVNRFPGQRGLLKRPDQTLEIALLADGVEAAHLYPLDVGRALRSLDRISASTFWWSSGAQGAQILIDGDVPACMEWNGRVDEPKRQGAPVDFHFNQCLFTSDCWVVPKGAANRKLSMEFIAFTLQPDRQAAYSRQIPYGPVNRQALKLLDAERLAVLPSSRDNFPGGTFENFDWWAENGQNVVARFNEWILG